MGDRLRRLRFQLGAGCALLETELADGFGFKSCWVEGLGFWFRVWGQRRGKDLLFAEVLGLMPCPSVEDLKLLPPNVCNPRFCDANTLIKGHIPCSRYPSQGYNLKGTKENFLLLRAYAEGLDTAWGLGFRV